MSTSYRPDYAGFSAFMRSDDVADAMRSVAEEAAERIRALAAPHRVTGAFEASIEVEDGIDGDRAVAYVLSRDYDAAWIEFGTVHTEGLNVFGRVAAEMSD